MAGRLTPVLHRKSLQLLPGPSRPKSAPSTASRVSADPGGEPRQIRPNSGSACAQNMLQSPKRCWDRTEQHSVVVSDVGSPSSRRFSQYTSESPFFAGTWTVELSSVYVNLTLFIRSESLICFSYKGYRTEGGSHQGDGAEGGSAEPFIAGIVGTNKVYSTVPDILS